MTFKVSRELIIEYETLHQEGMDRFTKRETAEGHYVEHKDALRAGFTYAFERIFNRLVDDRRETLFRLLNGMENCIENAELNNDHFGANYMKSLRDDMLGLLSQEDIDEFYAADEAMAELAKQAQDLDMGY